MPESGSACGASPTVRGMDTTCLAFYASLPSGAFDDTHLRRGRLGDLAAFIEEGTCGSTPTDW